MPVRPPGRRHVAVAGLAIVGLALAGLGQASASHLPVQADGNLVWSRAWADSPPEPPATPAMITWGDWFAHSEPTWLINGSSALEGHFPLVEPWEEVKDYTLVFVSDAGTAVVPGSGWIQNWSSGDAVIASFDLKLLKTQLVSGDLEPEVPYAFVLEVHRPDGTVAARSAVFWWGWTGDGSPTGVAPHASVTEPEGWAPPYPD